MEKKWVTIWDGMIIFFIALFTFFGFVLGMVVTKNGLPMIGIPYAVGILFTGVGIVYINLKRIQK